MVKEGGVEGGQKGNNCLLKSRGLQLCSGSVHKYAADRLRCSHRLSRSGTARESEASRQIGTCHGVSNLIPLLPSISFCLNPNSSLDGNVSVV